MIKLSVRDHGISGRSRITSGSRSFPINIYIYIYEIPPTRASIYYHYYIQKTAPALTVPWRERERNRVTRDTKKKIIIIIQKRHTLTRVHARVRVHRLTNRVTSIWIYTPGIDRGRRRMDRCEIRSVNLLKSVCGIHKRRYTTNLKNSVLFSKHQHALAGSKSHGLGRSMYKYINITIRSIKIYIH